VLGEQLEQTTILLEDVGVVPQEVFVDLGYRGVDRDNPGVRIVHRGRLRSLFGLARRSQLRVSSTNDPIVARGDPAEVALRRSIRRWKTRTSGCRRTQVGVRGRATPVPR